MKPLHLDVGDWHFVNGPWTTDDADVIEPPDPYTGDTGTTMQSLHFAFARSLCTQDCTARFEFKLMPHSDAGIILRAADESHFYMLHFPNCGQACRAQHFWVALSKMDDGGYLKMIKLEMVRRVPSNINIWLPCEVRVTGNRFVARIGDYGRFEATDDTYGEAGHVGLSAYGASRIRNVEIEANEAPAIWDDNPRQAKNWWYPVPCSPVVWQQPIDLKRFDDGELLLLMNIPISLSQDEDARAVPHLIRSTDDGQTWSEPQAFTPAGTLSAWGGARMNLTPGGRLLIYTPEREGKSVYESTDRGRTWGEPVRSNLHLGPPMETPSQQLSPQGFLNLKDGGILAFMLAAAQDMPKGKNIWTWGSNHCEGFSSRSDDDGLTWSDPVHVDNPGNDNDGNPIPGNLDLTEPCAVELGNGRIMAFVRPIYSPWMWESWSDDGGRTWGPCVRGAFPGYASPNMVRTVSGRLVLASRLPALTVNCSPDDGQTWDYGTLIDGAHWAMGSMCEVAPDVVLYCYWDDHSTLMRMQRFRVEPDGLQPVEP